MPAQYIRVLFPDARVVQVDDAACGQTNQVLILEEGTHRITLAGDPDYAPPFFEQIFSGTTPGSPLELHFDPAPSAASIAADAEHEAADAAFDAASADSHAADAPTPEELRALSEDEQGGDQ